jgi:hypothetical protein
MPRRLASLAAVISALSVAPDVLAEPEPKIAFRLDYQPAEGADCPDAKALAVMLAGEFGYAVVRTDVSPLLRVEIRRSGKGLVADIAAPDPTASAETWHGKTDTRITCHELVYDVAYTVRLRLGPSGWRGEEPPPSLAAPPEIDVGSVEIRPFEPRLPEFLAVRVPSDGEPNQSMPPGDTSPLVDIALGPTLSPLGLTSVGVGGSGLLGARWRRFALALDFRGMITPLQGVGPRDRPVRTSQWSGSLLPCAVNTVIDVCAAVAFSRTVVHIDGPGALTVSDGFNVGFGARVAARWQFADRFGLLGYLDGVADLRSLVLTGTTSDGTTVEDWRAPAIRLSLGVALSVTFAK